MVGYGDREICYIAPKIMMHFLKVKEKELKRECALENEFEHLQDGGKGNSI